MFEDPATAAGGVPAVAATARYIKREAGCAWLEGLGAQALADEATRRRGGPELFS